MTDNGRVSTAGVPSKCWGQERCRNSYCNLANSMAIHCGVEPWQRHAFQSPRDYCGTVLTDARMEEAKVVIYSKRKWFPTAPWSVQLRNFTQVTFLLCSAMQVVSVYACVRIKETARVVDTYEVPNKTCGWGVSGLCVLIHGSQRHEQKQKQRLRGRCSFSAGFHITWCSRFNHSPSSKPEAPTREVFRCQSTLPWAGTPLGILKVPPHFWGGLVRGDMHQKWSPISYSGSQPKCRGGELEEQKLRWNYILF